VLQVGSAYLPRWSGDLLIGSLQAGMLVRVRTTGDQVIYAERIDLSMRIRDLAQGKDGRLLIWNDDGQVVSLELATPTPAR
jgi:glucose/arabinose dehydrogenase